MIISMKRRRSEEHVACIGDLKSALNFRSQNLNRRYNLEKLGTDRRIL
jgi:hypothetical protein